MLFVLNRFALSALNGLKEINLHFNKNSAKPIWTGFTTILIVLFGLDGALIALVTNQAIVFIMLLETKQASNIKSGIIARNIRWRVRKKIAKFSVMAITSAICISLSTWLCEAILKQPQLGTSRILAGYVANLTMYLTIITTTLSVYYLPRLSK